MANTLRSVPSQSNDSRKKKSILQKLAKVLAKSSSRSLLYERIKHNDTIFEVLSQLITEPDTTASASNERYVTS